MSAPGDTAIDPRDVLVELDGPSVSPATVDAVALLRLAASFLRLVQANAAADDHVLFMQGVEIRDKCAAVSVRSGDPAVAQVFAARALRQIASEEAPHGLSRLVEDARSAVRQLPDGHTAKIIIGPWKRDMPTPPAEPLAPLDSMLSIRAVPIRAGGKTPVVRFVSSLEEDFSLSVSESQARTFGARLYKEVDIEAIVSRDGYGHIIRGELKSYFPVEDTDPREAWRDWYASVGGGEWDAIDDLDTELRH